MLCEKPFVWGVPQLAATARRLALGFEARGLLLWENCQWPYTLPAFERLHPGALAEPPRRLAMRLQPASRGVQMLGDSVPHALSLAAGAAPGRTPRVESAALLRRRGPEADALDLRFTLASGDRALDVEVELRRSDRQPRAAALAIDGRRARASGQPPTDTGYPSPTTAARCRCPIR